MAVQFAGDAGSASRLRFTELAGGDSEVMPGSGLGAKDTATPFDLVHIDLENAAFAPGTFDHQRDQRLFPFAQEAFLRPKKKVLGQLLCDGGTPGCNAAPFLVFLKRLLDALKIKAVMLHEFTVFGSNQCALQMRRDP